MKELLVPTIAVLLFVLVRSGDLCVSAAVGRDFGRALVYGFVLLISLFSMFFALGG